MTQSHLSISRPLHELVFPIQTFIIGLHVAFALVAVNRNIDETFSLYLLAAVFVCHSCWAVWSWARLTGRWFDPYVIFILVAVLFNGGQLIQLLLGKPPSELLGGEFRNDTLVSTAFLVSIGMALVHIGGISALIFNRTRNKAPFRRSIRERELEMNGLRTVGLIFFVIAVIPATYVLLESVSVAAKNGYMALYQRDFRTGFGATPRILANLLVPSSYLLLASYRGEKHTLRLSTILIALHSITYLYLGYRGHSLFPMIAYVWLWHNTVRRLPRWLFITAVALLVLLIPTIGTIRGLSGGDRMSLDVLIDSIMVIDKPMSLTLTEMGNTMSTVAHTIDLVPDARPFDWGASYVYAIATALPNLFWEIHPAIARGTPSEWLVWEVNPSIASLGGGYGYSFIAEAYFNFGWGGMPIILSFIGYTFARFVLWSVQTLSPARLAAVACFVPSFLFYTRADTSMITRPLMWYVVIPYLLVRLCGRLLGGMVMRYNEKPQRGITVM